MALTPKSGWGGQGLLGCDASYGYFNKIPLRAKDKEALLAKEGMHDLLSSLTTAPSKPIIVRDPQNMKRINKHVIEDSLHLYPPSQSQR